MPDDTPPRFAWAKLNAYGIILAGLALLGAADLYRPQGAQLAKLVGEVPPGQHFWVSGFVISGLLLMYGFVRHDRFSESCGLALMFASLAFQTAVAYRLVGWSDFTLTRLLILALIGLAGSARVSILWSLEGVVVVIPPRKARR